jgi:outer membrane protein insertion porin family
MKQVAHTLLFLALIAFSKISIAKNFFEITGNERVDEVTILGYLEPILNNNSNKKNIDEALKKLYETDLFLEVKIYQEKEKIVVEVKENPVVLDVKLVGNKKIEDEALENEMSLKKRAIYTKSKLQSDLKRISDIYLKSGRFLAKVEPKIIQKDQNRVEVIFDIFEGKKAKIADISFVGNENFPDQNLLDEISTKKSKWYKFFSSSDSYDSDRIEFDKEKLRRFYGARGFADFAVLSSSSEILPTKDKFYISFLLEEGIKYNLGEVNIVNNIEKFDDSVLARGIFIKKGKIYNSDLVEKSVDKMIEIMSDNAFAFASIDPVLKRNKEKKIIDVDFVINETPRVYINKINISGNVRTIDKVIRQELRIREGDAYNITKINRSRHRIQNLGFFEKVDLRTKKIQNDKVDIEIEVKEKKTGELNLGIGYSTVDKATASIGLKERNLFGTGQEIGMNVQKGTISSSNEISYTKPYFMDRTIDAGFDVFQYSMNKRNTLVYDQQSSGFTVRGDYSVTEFLQHQVRYSFSNETISNVDSFASINIKSLEGAFTKSGVGHTFYYDKRDSKFDPREGYLISMSQDYNGFNGNIRTIKYQGSAAYYLPIFTNDFVFKFMARGGIIDGIGQDVRSNDGFFLGGNNFRGFEYSGVGPRTVINGTAVGGNIIGGNIYYVQTNEFRFPLGLPKEIGISGALFTEAGTVKSVDSSTKRNTAIEDTGSIRASYGLSIAWSSPMGPIRFDFSRIAKKEVFDRTEAFRFSFGSTF